MITTILDIRKGKYFHIIDTFYDSTTGKSFHSYIENGILVFLNVKLAKIISFKNSITEMR